MDGGKGGAGVFQQIINQIPPHAVFIEAFLGKGAVLRNKRPAERTIGIELDAQVIAEHWRGDEVPNLEIMCGDALAFLRSYPWRGDEFLYLDPPYLMLTRSTPRPIYRREFATIEEHRELFTLLRSLPCPIAISGYHSWLYELELAGWRSISYQTVKRSGAVGVEHLWMNYDPPQELHDYSFLGDDFRAREQIGRLCERWQERLRRTPDPERQALLTAIEEVRGEFAGSPQEPLGYHNLGGDFRERERVARVCERWQERLRRTPDLERLALLVAIEQVRSEFAGQPVTHLDYHSLGGDFRERERIARKCERWQERLRRMPELERQALFAAIEQVRSEIAYRSLAGNFRERERVARKCKRWQEWLRRIPELVRQALFVAIDEVRSEFAEGPHAIIGAARAMCRRPWRPACSWRWCGRCRGHLSPPARSTR